MIFIALLLLQGNYPARMPPGTLNRSSRALSCHSRTDDATGSSGRIFVVEMLPADHQDDERAGFHSGPPLARGRGLEVCRRKKDIVRLEIEGHGARTALRRNIFHHRELIRRIFMHDSESSFAVGGKGIVRSGIETVGVHAFTN